MAREVDISNVALSHVGSDAIVVSINPPDGSVESGHCARFYPIARAELIESFSWTFAKYRVQLAEVANPSKVWQFAYALPADALNPVRVLNSFTLLDLGFLPSYGWVTQSDLTIINERGCADYDIEGGVLLTNEPQATLIYVRDITDAARFTPAFTTALSYLLASFLAGPIIKGDAGVSAAGKFRQIATEMAKNAQSIDANSSAEPASNVPDSIRARA